MIMRSFLSFSAELAPQSCKSLPDQFKVLQGGLPLPHPPLVLQAISGSGCNSSLPPSSQVLSEVPLHFNVSVNSELKEQERKIWVLHLDSNPPPPPPTLPPHLPTPVRIQILKKDALLPPPIPPRSVSFPDKIDVLNKVSSPPPLTLESPAIKKSSSPPTNPPPPPRHLPKALSHTVLCYFPKESSKPTTPAPERPPQPLSLTSSDKVLRRAPTPPRPSTMTTQLSVFLFSGAPSTEWMAKHMHECSCQHGLLSHQSFWTPTSIKNFWWAIKTPGNNDWRTQRWRQYF